MATQIDADLTGAVISGQVAIGEHIVQIHAEHGAIVNYAAPVLPQLRPVPVRALPRPFDGLVGRDRLLSEIHDAVATGAPTELVGAPGIGKTTLLRNISHHLAELRPDGVVYLRAAGLPAADVAQFLFETFYDCGGHAVVATAAQLSALLGPLEAFVLVDDADWQREELEDLTSLIARCTVVTGAVSQHLWGEGRSLAIAGLAQEAMVTLLERALGRALAGAERGPLLRFCQMLGGAPLRVLQLASLVETGAVTAEAIASGAGAGASAALDQLLAGGLSDAARLVVAPLAAVAAAVPTEMVAAVSGIGQASQMLQELEGRHLVQSHSPRYTLAADVADAGATDRAYEALVGTSLRRGGAPAELVLALSRQAAARQRPRDAITLAHVADRTLGLAGRWGAWGLVLEAARQAAAQSSATADEAWACHQLGSRALGVGDRSAAERWLLRALALREELGDTAGAQITRHNLDLLGGPGASGGRGGGPRPRLPLVLGAAVVAIAAGVAVALGASGGGSPVTPTTPTTPTTATTATTTTESTSTSPTSTATTTTTHSRTSSTRPTTTTATTPPLVLAFQPDRIVVPLLRGIGRAEGVATNRGSTAVSLTVTAGSAAYTPLAGACLGPLAPQAKCNFLVVVDSPGSVIGPTTLTFRDAGGRSQTLPVSACQVGSSTTTSSTTVSATTSTPTVTTSSTAPTTSTQKPINATKQTAAGAATTCPSGPRP